MQVRGVRNPNAVLASKDFALVIMQGWLRPGARKGDHFDVELRVPAQSDTTSLRGGVLLETRLMEMAVMDDHQVHHGNLLALAQGPVLIDPSHGRRNKAAAKKQSQVAASLTLPGPGPQRRRGPEIAAAGSGAHARLSEREIRRRRGQRH